MSLRYVWKVYFRGKCVFSGSYSSAFNVYTVLESVLISLAPDLVLSASDLLFVRSNPDLPFEEVSL
ncbi:hypothetical protein [Dipodfec virus RodF1_52]|uniref:Uncharacterized protein n=1 Tax=Dipodfec virus RodF1_52 TaxID=2929301 RepID=A0A976N2P1_9VIRU|nr:hypothetical protein [Dipodfec virus RodF1_52]